ncbi:hypothetical protein DMUE_2198 [Dictyocoela muelleri]|nr:hypothetical protein DMUE_2198 [Dictyocoela muelleri]
MRDILDIIRLFASNNSNTKICQELELSNGSVQKIINLIRRSLKLYMNNSISAICNSTIVETDETLIARRKNNRGILVVKQWLFGAIERDETVYFKKGGKKNRRKHRPNNNKFS